jgi:hypothetical protein
MLSLGFCPKRFSARLEDKFAMMRAPGLTFVCFFAAEAIFPALRWTIDLISALSDTAFVD